MRSDQETAYAPLSRVPRDGLIYVNTFSAIMNGLIVMDCF